jgi:hypothetical protein
MSKSNHYIPQYYLKGFSIAEDPSKVWVYKRGTKRAFCASTSNIAHENYFYALTDASGVTDTDSIEQFLANKVEGPANQVIDKLKMIQPIRLNEKQQLARYITYMYSRVPRYRERIKDNLPRVISERLSKLQKWSELVKDGKVASDPATDDIIRRIERVLKSSPDKLEQFISLPQFYGTIYNVLMNMGWSFLVRQEPPYFLTSDNPFIFTERRGLGNEKAEIIFPIAKNVMLWATWKDRNKFIPLNENINEVNKIIANNATRFVFYCEEAEWIYKLV